MNTQGILSKIFKTIPGVRGAVIVNPYEISADRGIYDGKVTRNKISGILPDVIRNIILTHKRIDENIILSGVLINTKNYYIYIRKIPESEDYLTIFISQIIKLHDLKIYTEKIIKLLKTKVK